MSSATCVPSPPCPLLEANTDTARTVPQLAALASCVLARVVAGQAAASQLLAAQKRSGFHRKWCAPGCVTTGVLSVPGKKVNPGSGGEETPKAARRQVCPIKT